MNIRPLGLRVVMWLDFTEHLDRKYAKQNPDQESFGFVHEALKDVKAPVFVDVGANQGLYSLAVVKGFENASVLAIDPDPYNIAKFRKNLGLNGVSGDRVIIRAIGVGLDEGLADLDINNVGNRGGSSMVRDQRKYTGHSSNQKLRVKTLSLHMLLEEFDCWPVDMLKIDIEGMETKVLADYFRVAPKVKFPRHMLVESNEKHDIQGDEADVIELLIRSGYRLVGHKAPDYFFRFADQE